MGGLWEGMRWDLRTFGRELLRRPAFGVVVIVTLALGIGATTTVYSVVQGVLLKPLPYPGGERMAEITGGGASSLANFRDLEERVESFDVMGAFMVPSQRVLTGSGEPVQVPGSYVTPDFFAMLGVRPVVGRLLGPEDLGTRRAVLSHGLWSVRFGGDPSVVGRTITLDGTGYEVVGVAPPSLTAPFDQELWLPVQQAPAEWSRGARNIYLYGRLAPGRDLAGAREEVVAEFERLKEAHPDVNGQWSVSLEALRAQLTGDQSGPLLMLLGGAALFLLVACANVASIFVSRLEVRRREFAVRSALGAGRGRLLRQAWTETTALSLLGGAAGLALTFLGVEAVLAVFGGTLSRADAVAVDGGVLAFVLAASLLTALLVGGMWIVGWRTDHPGAALRKSATSVVGRTGFIRKGLVVMQVAVALVLVTGLSLLVKSFVQVQSVELGVRTDDVVVATLGSLPSSRYPDTEAGNAFVARLLERLEAEPGIEGAAATDKLPLSGCCSNGAMARADDPETVERFVEGRRVSRDFFEVVGMRLLAGRSFGTRDRSGEDPVLVINQELADRLFGEENPVGRSIAAWGAEIPVIGVVNDVREYSPVRPAPPAAYLFQEQVGLRRPHLVLRTELPPERVAARLRAVLGELDPLLPVGGVETLEETVAETVGDRRATTVLMTLLGSLSFVLGAVGIYGVMSHAVHGRVREIGLRLALGASGRGVAGDTLWKSVRLILPGLVLGMVGVYFAQGVLASLLFRVDTFDPWVYAGVTVAFLLVAVVAGLAPARRAARVQPMEALRES